MTQVQMTDQQLNRALAELMGYTVRTYRNGKSVLIGPNLRIVSAKECFPAEVWEDAPDYCNNPAASLEVQAKALEVDHNGYILHLGKITRCGRTDLDEMFKDMLLAIPRERAEAAYITLSSVKE